MHQALDFIIHVPALLIDESFDGFVELVAKARNMDEAAVREIATGEVFWAAKAKDLGLIDELGDLDSAIDMAAEMSGAPRKPVWFRPRRGLRELLIQPVAQSVVDSVASEIEQRFWRGAIRY